MSLRTHVRAGETITIDGIRILVVRATDLIVMDQCEIIYPNGRVSLPRPEKQNKEQAA